MFGFGHQAPSQYANTIFEQTDCRAVDDGTIDPMFAGNVRKAQSGDMIIKGANLLRYNKNGFVIIGSGNELENIKKLPAILRFSTRKVIFTAISH